MSDKKGKSILIAEDEPSVLEGVQQLLQLEGYDVVAAKDGYEAVQKTHDNKVDLVLLDVMMPEFNGYQVCRLLKFDEGYKNIPIILLTARGQESDRKIGQDVGANDYVTKPYHPQELLAKITQYLSLTEAT